MGVRDLGTGLDTSAPGGKTTLPWTAGDMMITYTLGGGGTLTVRASGTEPKLKYYLEVLCTLVPGVPKPSLLDMHMQSYHVHGARRGGEGAMRTQCKGPNNLGVQVCGRRKTGDNCGFKYLLCRRITDFIAYMDTSL